MVCKKETKNLPKRQQAGYANPPILPPPPHMLQQVWRRFFESDKRYFAFLENIRIKLKHLQDIVMIIVIITHMLKILPDMLKELLTKMLIEMLTKILIEMLTKMLIEMSQSRKTAQGLAQLPRGVSLKLFSPASPENTQYAGARNIQYSWGPKYTIIWRQNYTIAMEPKYMASRNRILETEGPVVRFMRQKTSILSAYFISLKKQSTLEEMSRKKTKHA